jgi:hypothetical protein
MTRAELVTALCQRTNKNLTTLDSTTQLRLIGFLNQRQRRLLSMPGIKHLREATMTFDSVADQPDYVLPNIAKINGMRDPTTNQWTLEEMSLPDYRRVAPDPTETGTPTHYIWRSQMAVAKQPSDPSSLFVKSTSAADVSPLQATVEGVITGNYPMAATRIVTGVTAVDVAPTISTWVRIDKFYLGGLGGGIPAGVVTLHEDSGVGTELARIAIGKTQTNYTGLSLFQTPSSVITYTVDVTRAITDMGVTTSEGTDTPLLPEGFHDLLILGAIQDEYQHLSDDRYAIAAREYQQRVNELKYWLSETSTGQRGGLVRDWDRPSQLGPWYPPGS